MKIVQVCHSALCDNEPHQELVGNKATWFCCKKGFEQSLLDFSKAVAERYKCNLCKDKGFYMGKDCPAC